MNKQEKEREEGWEADVSAAAGDQAEYLSKYTNDQVKAFFADECEYTAEEKKSYDKAGRDAKHPDDFSLAMDKWQYERALRLGLDSSISLELYQRLRWGFSIVQKSQARSLLEWQEEAQPLVGFRRDATLHYVQTASDMRQALKDEQDDLRVKQYAMQVKQFFLRLDPARAKAFVRELTGSERGDWQKLFGYLDEIPDPPAKRLNPSYEKSKAFARTIRATHNTEQAILAARKAWNNAKDWNSFLDKKAQETVPALPAPKARKALSLGAESVAAPQLPNSAKP